MHIQRQAITASAVMVKTPSLPFTAAVERLVAIGRTSGTTGTMSIRSTCAARRAAPRQWSYPYQDPTRLDLASLVGVWRRSAPGRCPRRSGRARRCGGRLDYDGGIAADALNRQNATSAVDWGSGGLRALAQVRCAFCVGVC